MNNYNFNLRIEKHEIPNVYITHNVSLPVPVFGSLTIIANSIHDILLNYFKPDIDDVDDEIELVCSMIANEKGSLVTKGTTDIIIRGSEIRNRLFLQKK